MTHLAFVTQLDAYLDDELAPGDARALEAHVAQCPDCARLRDARLALRAEIKRRWPPLAAPAPMRERVRTALRAAAPARARRRFDARLLWRPLALAASVAAVAIGSWQVALRSAAEQRLAQDVLDSHIRSLMPGHLTDVRSSDQHTVKPWFNGRLDFSPPVPDFSADGYPLLGGRLDYLAGRAVAALVYGRRQHLINVFLWPASGGSSAGSVAPIARQGYHLLHRMTAEYTYWVVSDLGLPELETFSHRFEQAAAAGSGRSSSQ